MIVPAPIQQRFDLWKPYVDRVASTVKDIVFSYCEKSEFAFVGRKKEVASASEKIESGRYARWSELDDLYGCSIIVPTLARERATVEFLESTFEMVEIRKRGGTLKQPDVFRFDATRFVGRLRVTEAEQPETQLSKVLFEVQVRTAFEHAWSVATRDFAYKADQVDWRKFRLAAQLKASVEQLDALVIGFDAISDHLSEHEWPALTAKKHLENSLKRLLAESFIPVEVAPVSWTRFCDNLWTVISPPNSTFRSKAVKTAVSAAQIIESRIRTVGADSFPRSITLLQFCLAILVEEGFIIGPVSGYTPLITKELLDLHPAAIRLGAGFQFDDTGPEFGDQLTS